MLRVGWNYGCPIRVVANRMTQMGANWPKQFSNWSIVSTFSSPQCPTESSTPKADNFLQSALLQFPTVLHHLLDKCSVSPDPRVEKHPHFSLTKEYSLSDPLNQLVNLYAARSLFVLTLVIGLSLWSAVRICRRWFVCTMFFNKKKIFECKTTSWPRFYFLRP